MKNIFIDNSLTTMIMKPLKYRQEFEQVEFESLIFDLDIIQLPLEKSAIDKVFEWPDIGDSDSFRSRDGVLNHLFESLKNGFYHVANLELKDGSNALKVYAEEWLCTKEKFKKKDNVKDINYFCDYARRILLRVETKNLWKNIGDNSCHQKAIEKVITAHYFY